MSQHGTLTVKFVIYSARGSDIELTYTEARMLHEMLTVALQETDNVKPPRKSRKAPPVPPAKGS